MIVAIVDMVAFIVVVSIDAVMDSAVGAADLFVTKIALLLLFSWPFTSSIL